MITDLYTLMRQYLLKKLISSMISITRDNVSFIKHEKS